MKKEQKSNILVICEQKIKIKVKSINRADNQNFIAQCCVMSSYIAVTSIVDVMQYTVTVLY